MRTAITAESHPLALGDSGVAFTVANMRVQAEQGARTPSVREYALNTVRNVASRDTRGEIDAIFQRVKKEIKFRGEYGETVQDPVLTLRWQAGDCDDQAALLASLLMSLGYDVEFVTIAPDGGDFGHVYVQVFDRTSGAWLPLDSTVKGSYAGWQAPNPARRRLWGTMKGMSGLAGLGDDPGAFNPSIVDAYAYRIKYPEGGPATGFFLNADGNAMLLVGLALGALFFSGRGHRGRR